MSARKLASTTVPSCPSCGTTPKKLQRLPVQVEKVGTFSYQLQYPICQRSAPLSTNSPSLLHYDPSMPFSVPCFGVTAHEVRGMQQATQTWDKGLSEASHDICWRTAHPCRGTSQRHPNRCLRDVDTAHPGLAPP